LVKKWAKHNWSLAGLLFVYIACFLTESEEHEIVDHLSTWWITIKDRQQAAESGLAAFLAGITGFISGRNCSPPGWRWSRFACRSYQ